MAALSRLITDAAAVGVSMLDDRGRTRMPAGHNGPWNDDVTALRNTGHWAILFFEAYDRSGEQRYYDAATDCINWLCRDAARPNGWTFHHRDEPEKDRCNGLVGQGWSIEALAIADRYVDSATPRTIATEVFELHPFDEEMGLWRSVDVDGTVGSPLETINQQLWFAAAGSLLCRDGKAPAVRRPIVAFLDDLEETVETYRNGIVYHSGYPYDDSTFFAQRIGARLWGNHERLHLRSVGYHSFILYALGVLKRSFPAHPLWQSDFVDQLLVPIDDIRYKNEVINNVYAFDYNPTGIELAFALDVFRDGEGASFWLNEQFRRCYDADAKLLRHGWDEATLAARLYEATRLRDREIPIGGPGGAGQTPSAGRRVDE